MSTVCKHLLLPGQRFPLHTACVADRYGLFFRSKVCVKLSAESVGKVLSQETAEVQRLFPVLEQYISNLFGNPGAVLAQRVTSILNHVLGIYRVVFQEWHAVPVAQIDLVSWRLLKVEAGIARFLMSLDLPHQILFPGESNVNDGSNAQFAKVLASGSSFNTLNTLEADIHDRVSHGDLLVAIVLMGLLVEEGLRDHLLRFLMLRESITRSEANSRLTKRNGHVFGIGDLVDDPSARKNSICIVEKLAGWRPYEYAEYVDWNANVRFIRNEVIHKGRKEITPADADSAWSACVAFLALSFKCFVGRLFEGGIHVEKAQAMLFYGTLSSTAGTPGLFGSFNHT